MTPQPRFPRCGITYVAQQEHEYGWKHKLALCQNCHALGWDKPLKRCVGCLLVDYSSRECQKAKWTSHKPFCSLVQGKGIKSAYLTAQRSRDVVFRKLIDSYRLRVEVDHVQRNEDHGCYYPGGWEDGIVWAKGDAIEDFQLYLDLVETSGILPEWWGFVDRMECLGVAIDEGDRREHSIFTKIDQESLIPLYDGDLEIRIALLILAELVVGYEGKGRAETDEWYEGFVKYLKDTPEDREKLLGGSRRAVDEQLRKHGNELPLEIMAGFRQ